MTSGVKQALPQMPMPKPGIEGRPSRNRMPQGNFAEALGIGKLARQPRAVEAKPGDGRIDRQEAALPPSWQRLATKLDTAIDRAQPVAKPEAVVPQLEKSRKDAEAGSGLEEPRGETAGTADQPLPNVASDAVDATEALARTPAPVPVRANETKPADTQGPWAAVPSAGEMQAAVSASKEPRAAIPPPREPHPRLDRDAAADERKASSPVFREETASASAPFVPVGRGEEPARFEAAARPAATAERPPTDRAKGKETTPDVPAEPARPAPRVTVVGQQNIPAPMQPTALVLVESIAASDLLEPAVGRLSLDQIYASAAPASAQSLKIQLHPAELGMVTATLRFAGEQLSIELQVENHEAYRRLTGDSDTIVNALRDLGYDIDRVSVLQPSVASTPAGRTDTGGTMPSPQGRAPEQFGAGTTGGGNGGSGGRAPEDGGNAGRNDQQAPPRARERQGGDLYI